MPSLVHLGPSGPQLFHTSPMRSYLAGLVHSPGAPQYCLAQEPGAPDVSPACAGPRTTVHESLFSPNMIASHVPACSCVHTMAVSPFSVFARVLHTLRYTHVSTIRRSRRGVARLLLASCRFADLPLAVPLVCALSLASCRRFVRRPPVFLLFPPLRHFHGHPSSGHPPGRRRRPTPHLAGWLAA